MFGAITPTYDRLNHLLSASLDRRWRAVAARETLRGLAPCRRLLDVATGTGDLAMALRKAVGRAEAKSGDNAPRCEIFGLDFTRPMLKTARQKYGQRPFSWIEGDGLNLPTREGSFDAVTIAFGLRNMVDRSAAVREMVRVLRPGGRLAILEFSQPRNPVFRALYDFYSYQVMPRVGRLISGSDAYLYLAESIREFWSPEQLRRQMETAGLGSVRVFTMGFGIVCLHIGTKLERNDYGNL